MAAVITGMGVITALGRGVGALWSRMAEGETGIRRIERFDTAILKPQRTELGGFILIQGTKEQIDALRDDHDFARWVTQIQLVADKVGIVDARVNQWVPDAIGL